MPHNVLLFLSRMGKVLCKYFPSKVHHLSFSISFTFLPFVMNEILFFGEAVEICWYLGCTQSLCWFGKIFFSFLMIHLLYTACPAGQYGPGCLMRCSCHADASCDPKNGTCICPPGKMGHDCSTTCEAGFWGQGCIGRCRCQEHSVGCDPVSGQCVCEAGYTGDYCEE
ncbi:hypothetical protein ATANTOWER_015647, partial [Ataeniobius toweri]|nr:hypothetical protein [Ataeniobius toweri]